MNTVKIWRTASSRQEDTFAIGERLGRACKGGEVFLLTSDLGGGKTTFTKGLAKGLGVGAIVTSPTFTISRVYSGRDGLKLIHFDFYRLPSAGMAAHELSEVIGDKLAVTVIEWGEVVEGVLPDEYLEIKFNRTKDGENYRSIIVKHPDSYSYILKDTK